MSRNALRRVDDANLATACGSSGAIEVDSTAYLDDALGGYLRIEDEIIGPVTLVSGTTVTGARGYGGTTAAAHAAGVAVNRVVVEAQIPTDDEIAAIRAATPALSGSNAVVSVGGVAGYGGRLPGIRSERSIDIREYSGVYANGASTTDAAPALNAIIEDASERAASLGVKQVEIVGFGSDDFYIRSRIILKPNVKICFDEATVRMGTDFAEGEGMIRAPEVWTPAHTIGTADTTSGDFVLTNVTNIDEYYPEMRLGSSIIGLAPDTKVVAVDVQNDRLVLDHAPNATNTGVTITQAGTYYGSYKHITMLGGFIDPNGFDPNGKLVRACFTEHMLIDGMTIYDRSGEIDDGYFALNLGGRHGTVRSVRTLEGHHLYHDGIHLYHGQDWTFEKCFSEAGDDAIAIGNELDAVGMDVDPDPIRRINIVNNSVRVSRGAAVKLYVVSGATGRDWEITDVNINVLNGQAGLLRNGGVWIEDFNHPTPAGVAASTDTYQIREVNINNIALDVGSKGHDGINPECVTLRGAKNVTIDNIEINPTDGQSVQAFDTVYADGSEDVTISSLRTTWGTRWALWLIETNRFTLKDSKLTRTANSGQHVRLGTGNTGVVFDNVDFLNCATDKAIIRATEGSGNEVTVRNCSADATVADAGYLIENDSGKVARMIVRGNDFDDLQGYAYSGGSASTGMTNLRGLSTFRVENNVGLPDVRDTDTPYEKVFSGSNRLDALAIQDVLVYEAGSTAASGGSAGRTVFYFDPDRYRRSGESLALAIELVIISNNTAPTSNFTAALVPISSPAGGAAGVTVTEGSATATTDAIAAPAANSTSVELSDDFTAPSAGYYALRVSISGSNMAASSAVAARATLLARAL